MNACMTVTPHRCHSLHISACVCLRCFHSEATVAPRSLARRAVEPAKPSRLLPDENYDALKEELHVTVRHGHQRHQGHSGKSFAAPGWKPRPRTISIWRTTSPPPGNLCRNRDTPHPECEGLSGRSRGEKRSGPRRLFHFPQDSRFRDLTSHITWQ